MAQIVVDCIIDDSMSEFEKAISIHDWLTFNVDYDYTYSKYDAINAFRDRTCVCQGYAQAFEMMVELVGIEATFVGGTGTNSSGKTESHAWNQVKISGIWYNVDVTWDDPASAGKDPDDHSGNRYDYFLISDSELEKDHVAEDYYEDKHTCSKSYDRKTIFKYAINSGVHEDAAFVETLADMNAAIKQYMNAEKTEFWMWYYNTSLTSSNCATYLQNEMTKASYFATISKYYYPEDGVTKCLVSITPMSEWNKIPVVTNVNEFTALLDKNGDAGVTTYTIRYEASSGTPEVAATTKYGLEYSYYSYNDGKSMLMTVTIK